MAKQSAYFVVGNIHTKQEVHEIKRKLENLPGVFSVAINASNSSLSVDYDTTGTNHDQLQQTISNLGHQAKMDAKDERTT